MAYIVGNAQSKIVICDDQTQLDKYSSIAKGDSTIEHIVTMDDLGSSDPRVITLAALMEKGDSVDDAELDARLAAVQMDDVALLVYHLGHDRAPQRGDAHAPRNRPDRQRRCGGVPLAPRDENPKRQLSTPVSRGRAGDDQLCRAHGPSRDVLLRRPHADQGLPGRGAPDDLPGGAACLGEVRRLRFRGKLAEATGIKAKLASWARQTELEAFKQEAATGRPVSSFSRNLANKLVISKIKDALGLDQLQVALSGAAPDFGPRPWSSLHRSACRFTRATA